MARPRVTDGGNGQLKKGGPPAWRLVSVLTFPHHKKKKASYEMLHRVSELHGFFGTTQTTKNGCEIWNMKS